MEARRTLACTGGTVVVAAAEGGGVARHPPDRGRGSAVLRPCASWSRSAFAAHPLSVSGKDGDHHHGSLWRGASRQRRPPI